MNQTDHDIEPHLTAAQQYFPTYKLDPKRQEIGLKEYELAANALESGQRSLSAAAGIALFVGGAAATFISSSEAPDGVDQITNAMGTGLQIFISALIFVLSILAVSYFALLQRSATYAARKIVILRRLLGLDYGNIETVLPTNRLDGANEPFAIDMFPGWRSIQAVSVIAVGLLSGILQSTFFVIFDNGTEFAIFALGVNFGRLDTAIFFGVIIFCTTLLAYRIFLLDDFENLRLFSAQILSKYFNLPMKKRIGHILYRTRLSVFEAKRLEVDLDLLHPFLILIEDRRFYKHNGNSIIAIFAAIYRWSKYNSLSGGSTIYQQLVRTNFVTKLDKKFRRKIIEWMLAPWLNKRFSKSEGLDAYLCSVRFARGVFGIPAAIKYYFPTHEFNQPLEPYQRFLLIERLSNVSGTYPAARIQRYAELAEKEGLLKCSDFNILNDAYIQLSKENKIDLRGQIPNLFSKLA